MSTDTSRVNVEGALAVLRELEGRMSHCPFTSQYDHERQYQRLNLTLAGRAIAFLDPPPTIEEALTACERLELGHFNVDLSARKEIDRKLALIRRVLVSQQEKERTS